MPGNVSAERTSRFDEILSHEMEASPATTAIYAIHSTSSRRPDAIGIRTRIVHNVC